MTPPCCNCHTRAQSWRSAKSSSVGVMAVLRVKEQSGARERASKVATVFILRAQLQVARLIVVRCVRGADEAGVAEIALSLQVWCVMSKEAVRVFSCFLSTDGLMDWQGVERTKKSLRYHELRTELSQQSSIVVHHAGIE